MMIESGALFLLVERQLCSGGEMILAQSRFISTVILFTFMFPYIFHESTFMCFTEIWLHETTVMIDGFHLICQMK